MNFIVVSYRTSLWQRLSFVRHIPVTPGTVAICIDIADGHLIAKERQATLERFRFAERARDHDLARTVNEAGIGELVAGGGDDGVIL